MTELLALGEPRESKAPLRQSQNTFLLLSALVTSAGIGVAVARRGAMPSMVGQAMHAGGSVAMQDKPASFMACWLAMNACMMLPSLGPHLWRYRLAAAAAGPIEANRMTAKLLAAYSCIWAAAGMIVLLLDTLLTRILAGPSQSGRAVDAAGIAVILAGAALQFSGGKLQLLSGFRKAARCPSRGPADGRLAWLDGFALGLHCFGCSLNLTAVLFVVGLMKLSAMVLLTCAVTAERLAPASWRVPQLVGTFFWCVALASFA